MAIGRRIQFQEEEDQQDVPVKIGRPVKFKQKDVSKIRSLISAFPKGIAKGLLDIAEMGVPLAFQEEEFEERQQRQREASQARKKIEEDYLERALPTQEGFIESSLERGGRAVPFGVGIPAALASGFIGETAKELGAGEATQSLAEAGALGLPALGRKILPTASQKPLVEFARKAGLTEKQIAPLLPDKNKKEFFRKVASKGEKTQEALRSSRQGVSQAYEFVKDSPAAKKTLNQQQAVKFLTDSTKIAYQMPFEIRKQIAEDAKDLIKHGFTGENLINYYQDISSKYKIGREHLERFKKPILEAMESISPELSEDFKLANDLFKRQLSAKKALKPNISSELLDLGEVGKLAYSISTLSMKGLTELLGISASRKFAREMLINPRLQNIHKQIIKAANERKYGIVKDLSDYIKKRYEDESSPIEK